MEYSISNEKFIAVVMEYPYLYDNSKSEFKDIQKKDRTWAVIGNKFHMTGESAKKFFKSLREKYVRIKRNTRSGAEAPKEKDWDLLKLMSFLEEIIRPRRSIGRFTYLENNGNKELDSVSSDCESNMDTDYILNSSIDIKDDNVITPVTLPIEYQTVPGESDSTSSAPCMTTQTTGTESRKRKIVTSDSDIFMVCETLKDISKSLQNKKAKTDRGSFCEFLNDEMEKLPNNMKEQLQDEIMLLLVEKRKLARNIP